MDHSLSHQFHLVDGILRVTPPLTGEEDDLLGLSIQKWESIVALLEAGEYVQACGGRRTCALCPRYRENKCANCPINIAGHPYCDDTPYCNFEDNATGVEEKLAAAKAEVEFLKSLRGRNDE